VSFLKKRRKKRGAISGEMELQITSMADIFTILLVFLLKSYASSAVEISPSAGLKLPTGSGSETMVEALKVEISDTGVTIEGEPAAPLEHSRFPASVVEQNGTTKSLNEGFQKLRQRQLAIAQKNSQVKVDSKIVIVADQKIPYQTIKTVLASAAVNGYTDFKLAVVKGE
jgi:biopolymer transport protein ExbD